MHEGTYCITAWKMKALFRILVYYGRHAARNAWRDASRQSYQQYVSHAQSCRRAGPVAGGVGGARAQHPHHSESDRSRQEGKIYLFFTGGNDNASPCEHSIISDGSRATDCVSSIAGVPAGLI